MRDLLLVALVMVGIVIGIPVAVEYQWPAVVLALLLWLAVYIQHRRATRSTSSTKREN